MDESCHMFFASRSRGILDLKSVMDESCHRLLATSAALPHYIAMWKRCRSQILDAAESCRTHVTHMNESCRTFGKLQESCHTHE